MHCSFSILLVIHRCSEQSLNRNGTPKVLILRLPNDAEAAFAKTRLNYIAIIQSRSDFDFHSMSRNQKQNN